MPLLGEGQPSTIILVTVDCLRFDTVSARMPTLTGLAEEFVDASDTFCTGSGTPTSMSGLWQSRLPTDHGGRPGTHELPVDPPTLPEAFRDAGYSTAGWHSNINTGRNYGYDRGFDVFADLKTDSPDQSTDEAPESDSVPWIDRLWGVAQRFGVDQVGRDVFYFLRRQGLVDQRPEATADEVTDALLSWLPPEEDGRRRFGWLHYMDTHSPYAPPKRYRREMEGCPTSRKEVYRLNDQLRHRPQDLADDEVHALKCLYDAAARYVDDELGRTVDELRRRGYWEDCLLVVTSDHGEMFADHEIPDDYPFQHPNFLYETVTHVPLVFAGGGVPSATVDHIASGMDVGPTVLDAAGVEVPSAWRGPVIGEDEFYERDAVFSVTGRGPRQDTTEGEIPGDTLHVSLRTDDHSVLWWSHPALETEYFSRTDGAEERADASDVPREYVERIEEEFLDVAREHADSEVTGTEGLDERSVERLRQLGYLPE